MMPTELPLVLLLQIGALVFGAAQGQMRADGAGEVRLIHRGERITQEIGGRKVDRYSVRLEAGQYARFTAKELGINVVVSVSGTSGVTIVEMNRSNGTRGSEAVSVIADQTGVYIFHVRAFAPVAAHGQYEASITEPRVATEADRAVAAAEATFAGAERSWVQHWSEHPGRESLELLLKQFVEAGSLARASGDCLLEGSSLYWCGVVCE